MKQNMEALALANEVRFANSKLKAGLRSGELDWTEVIEKWDAPINLFQLLGALDRVGQSGVARILKGAALSGEKKLCQLTTRERLKLIVAIRSVRPGLKSRAWA